MHLFIRFENNISHGRLGFGGGHVMFVLERDESLGGKGLEINVRKG
jgi:hypothetical protein